MSIEVELFYMRRANDELGIGLYSPLIRIYGRAAMPAENEKMVKDNLAEFRDGGYWITDKGRAILNEIKRQKVHS